MPRRSPNGSSSIYQGSDGLWHTWVHAGTKPDGTLDRRHVKRKTATAVKTAADELRERLAQGHAPTTKIETVEQWLMHWVENIVKPRRAHKTYTAYLGLIRNYAIPHIGRWRLDGSRRRLEPEHVEAMYAAMAETEIVRGSRGKDHPPTVSASTIHKMHRMLSVALKAAVRRKKASRNVCSMIDPPAFRAKKVAALTVAETQAVLEAALADEQAARWLVGMILGPRQGETLGLRWPLVHLDPPRGEEPYIELESQLQRRTWRHGCSDPVACTVDRHRTQPCRPPWVHGCQDASVCTSQGHRCPRRQAGRGCRRHTRPCPPLCPAGCVGHARRCPERVGGGLVEVDLKSERSIRAVALPAILVELLRRHRERQQQLFETLGREWTPEGLVFVSARGRPVDASQDHRAWEALLQRAGVDDAKLHAARHTAGTMLIASGADISVVQEVLGHTDIKTSRIYVDVAKKTQREALDRAMSAVMEGNLAVLLQPFGATSSPKS